MTVRKGLSLLICALLLVSVFAGCGSGAAQNTTAAATQAQTQGTTAQATTAQATQAKAPVSIGFFHWKGEEKDTWDKIINMFQEKNPGITVNMEILPEDQYYTKLQAEVMAGESQGLDVFEVNPGSRFKTFLRADAYMDLTGQPFLNDLSPIYLSCGQDNGKQYIIPLSKSFVGIFYNKTILAKTGMDVPKTWDDFLKVCEAIKKSGVQVIATGMADAWTSTLPFLEILVQQSDDLQIYPKLAKGEMKFTDPLFKNVLTPLNELAKKGYIMKNASGTKYEQSLTLFATGKAAMLNQGTWAI